MNSIHRVNSKHDLLTNKYRPTKVDDFTCNAKQALQLRKWIQDFLNSSKENKRCKQHHKGDVYDDDYSSTDSENEKQAEFLQPKCVLLTGPHGVGKTSLVYTIADELKLHVVESHSAEKRDFKLFTSLKLANQKGKINPIAKLFQAAVQKDAVQRVKRQKMTLPAENGNHNSNGASQQLSLSSDTSILLFDDIDVVFEEDGPFLKSLVDFIKESKRPIVLTSTRSNDTLKRTLACFEHIHLNRPSVEDCAKLLRNVCLKENYDKTGKKSICLKIANYYDCDIRRCLNKIHFYGNQVDKLTASFQNEDLIDPKFDHLNLIDSDTDTDTVLDCYTNRSLIDLMDKSFHINSKSLTIDSSIECENLNPRKEEEDFCEELGKQIKNCIAELSMDLSSGYLMTEKETVKHMEKCSSIRMKVNKIGHIISEKLVTRIEPHEHEFFTDIVPLFSEIAKLETIKKVSQLNGDTFRRRSRRAPSYLDDKGLYFENEEIKFISENIIDWNN